MSRPFYFRTIVNSFLNINGVHFTSAPVINAYEIFTPSAPYRVDNHVSRFMASVQCIT